MLTQDQLHSLPVGTVLDVDGGPPATIMSNSDDRLVVQFTVTREMSGDFAHFATIRERQHEVRHL